MIATFSLGGCTYPNDLKLIGLEKVNGLPQSRALDERQKYHYTQADHSGPFLEIRISSRVDLLQYARGKTGMSVSAEFCDAQYRVPDIVGSPAPDMVSPFHMFSNGDNLPDLLSDLLFSKITELPRLSPGPDGRIVYHVYLAALGSSYHPEQRWDLIDSPHDVCLHTGVGAYPAHRSNTVRIPADLISAALR